MSYGWLRLAHMSPDSMGVDFCVTGSDGLARPLSYGMPGVVYPGAGPYVAIPTGTCINLADTCLALPVAN